MLIDHIHFYVDDASRWCDWFVRVLQFERVVWRSPFPWMNLPDTHTEWIRQGALVFALSSPLTAQSPVAEFLCHHPMGVADVAFQVSQVKMVVEKAITSGAQLIKPVTEFNGYVWGKIAKWRSLSHTLISPFSRPFQPGKLSIDHLVINIPQGELESTACWYEQIFGFKRQQRFEITTERSGLRSLVLTHPESGFQLPLNEPTSVNSQIQEFLDLNHGVGVQHLALHTPNLLSLVPQLKTRGLNFLSVPHSYYHQLQDFPLPARELTTLAHYGILADWQQEALPALLLQIFTQPIFPQPTFFLEFIERRFQAQGFGEGNFRALFQAVEHEQIKRTTGINPEIAKVHPLR